VAVATKFTSRHMSMVGWNQNARSAHFYVYKEV
jgi:hypothetical protein